MQTIYTPIGVYSRKITDGDTEEEGLFVSAQEAVLKDVERAFGVLIARFHILTHGCRTWYCDDIKHVIITFVIIHNMVFEVRQDSYSSGMCVLGMYRDTEAIFGAQFVWQ